MIDGPGLPFQLALMLHCRLLVSGLVMIALFQVKDVSKGGMLYVFIGGLRKKKWEFSLLMMSEEVMRESLCTIFRPLRLLPDVKPIYDKVVIAWFFLCGLPLIVKSNVDGIRDRPRSLLPTSDPKSREDMFPQFDLQELFQ